VGVSVRVGVGVSVAVGVGVGVGVGAGVGVALAVEQPAISSASPAAMKTRRKALIGCGALVRMVVIPLLEPTTARIRGRSAGLRRGLWAKRSHPNG
jgi:hypothetical protein